MNMLRPVEMTHAKPEFPLTQNIEVGRPERRTPFLPALLTPEVDARKERQKEAINALFPQEADLRRLIADIPTSYAGQFAEVMGSVDFAEERLAGFLAALERLANEIQERRITTVADIRKYVELEGQIHEVFEDLVIRCALNSL